MDEFGDRSVTETLDIGISSPEDIELEEGHSSNTEGIDLDEFLGREGVCERWRIHLLRLSLRIRVSILLVLFQVAFRRVDSVLPAGPAVEV